MLRKLTAAVASVTAGVMMLSVMAHAAPPKKKKKKPKHTTTAPAATPAPAPTTSAGPSPELYVPPKEKEEEAPAPTPSAPAASEPVTPAPTDSAAPSEGEAKESTAPADHASASSSLPPFSVAVLAGWGFNNAAKLGLGARAGYTLPFHVYVGATFVYHLGESENGATANFFFPGGEVGYELALGPLLVRPYAGVGALVLHVSVPPESATRMYVAVWPGATVAYSITPAFFIGVDARYMLSSYDIFGVFGTAGARF